MPASGCGLPDRRRPRARLIPGARLATEAPGRWLSSERRDLMPERGPGILREAFPPHIVALIVIRSSDNPADDRPAAHAGNFKVH